MNKDILGIVKECDNFSPDEATSKSEIPREGYEFRVYGFDYPLGYILSSTVEKVPWSESWSIDHRNHTVTLVTPVTATTDERSRVLEETLISTRNQGTFSLLQHWRNETFPVFSRDGETILVIERCASALFGIVTYGVQLICHVSGEEGLRLWIAKRSEKKQTYPGMLDTTAAGGLASGTLPIEAIISEAKEEASIPELLVRNRAKPMSPLTYFHVRGSKAGGESGLFQPEVEYTYQMELDPNFTPRPRDTEVECFKLFAVEEVLCALKEGLFKPNSAIVIVEFLMQHGILNPDNEPNYDEILSHLHRKLEFPVLIQPSW